MWHDVTAKISKRVWLTAGAASVVLLALVVSQSNVALIRSTIATLAWGWFIAALVLLLAEGFLTALRMQVFTPGVPSYRACLKISAWFVLFLIALPARLGEVVAVILLRKYAGQSTGSALANLLTQRVFDLLVLMTVFALLVLLINGLPMPVLAFVSTAALCALLVGLVWWLDRLLGLIARAINRLRQRYGGTLLRQMLKAALQARGWRRHHMTSAVALKGFAVTLIKWVANLGGLTLLFVALGIPVDLPQALLLAAAFNLLAIVPLQTVGGIGLSEVGLSGLLMLFGADLEYAASISIVVRLVLMSTPVMYWALVVLLLTGRETASIKEGVGANC